MAVDLLGPFGAAQLGEPLDRAAAGLEAHRGGMRGVGCQREHRRSQRLGVAGRHEQARLSVPNEVLEPADRRRDHRPRALHRLERDHPEPLAERGDDDRQRILDRLLNGRHMAEEADGAVQPELAREVLEPVLEHAAAGDVERRVGPLVEHLPERAQQHDMSLDRDQAPDTEEAGRLAGVRLRLRPGGDPVVDDLEVGLGEAFRLRQVAGEAARDRDLPVRERADRAVAEREEPPLPELVEAVLRREPDRHPGERSGRLAVRVGVDEVRVQDRRPVIDEVGEHLHERARIDVGLHLDPVDGHAAGLESPRELPRAGLLLVEHQEADVPAVLHERRQELQQVGLGARDSGDLLDVEDGHCVRVRLGSSRESRGRRARSAGSTAP